MERLTGWRARTTFADGLEQTVAWYRENEAWWRERPERRPRLLVLGAGPAQLGLLEAARERDLHVIAARPRPAAPWASCSPTSAPSSPPRTSSASSGSPAPARSTASSRPGADWPVGIAARVAERLGLPHPIDGATAVLATSKARQRERLARGGRAAAAALRGRRPALPFPCVVKAADQQGQRGLTLVRERDELDAALAGAVAESRIGGALVRGARRRAPR